MLHDQEILWLFGLNASTTNFICKVISWKHQCLGQHEKGDKERSSGLPVAAFMDRGLSTLEAVSQTQVLLLPITVGNLIQVNFIQFVATPLFQALHAYKPVPELMDILQANKEFWANKLQQT